MPKRSARRLRREVEHRSYRLARSLAHGLEERAKETGATQTDLVQRYIDEGLRMDAHPQIAFRSAAAGRRPAIAGTRLDVWKVIETVKGTGGSVEEAASLLDVPEAKVRACVSYYAEFKEEVDAWTQRMHEMAEAEEAAWRREQEVLA